MSGVHSNGRRLIDRVGRAAPVEVAVRNLYWRSSWINKRFRNSASAYSLSSASSSPNNPTAPEEQPPEKETLGTLISALTERGVRHGGILLVHSSDDAIRNLGVSPRRLNDALIDMLGSAGTLAEPAFPRLSGQATGIDWMREQPPYPLIEYDVRRSSVTTGVLGWDLMRRPGAVRSMMPFNSLAALGAKATELFRDELVGELPTPCGPQSAWNYLVEHSAMVAMIGVDVAHTLTLNHVAEDKDPDAWPVKSWYRERDVAIKVGNKRQLLRVREREPRWAMFYAEGKLNRDLRSHGIVEDFQVSGVPVAVFNAIRHQTFLANQPSRIYPYFGIPFWQRKRSR